MKKNPIELAKETLIELGVSEGAIGIEKDCWWLTIEQYEELGSLLPQATFKNCSRLVDTIRLIKSEREVEYIRQAAKIIDKAMVTGIEAIEEGRTDTDVAIAIDNTLKAEGSEYLECPILVGSGPGLAFPHTTYVGRKLDKGDVFLLEAAAVVRRYHAALLRCAVLGEPSRRQRQAAQAVLKGVAAALDMMNPGIPAGEVDRASREIVREAGFEADFDHRTGYHIGVAFAPNWVGRGFSINVGIPDILQSGMVFHLLASLFIPGLGGGWR